MAGCVKEQSIYDQSIGCEIPKLIASGVRPEDASQRARQKVAYQKRENDKTLKMDVEGIEGIAEGASFSFTEDGRVHFDQFDAYLDELYENQKSARPKEYKQEERDTVVSAYDALRNGATQSAHIAHYFDENGKLSVRDGIVLDYDKKTNTGRMYVLNISENGKNHQSLESAREALAKRLRGFKEQQKSDTVFLFVREDTPIDPTSLFRQKSESPEIRQRQITMLHDREEKQQDESPVGCPKKERVLFLRPVFQADKKKSPVLFRLPVYLQRLMGRDEKGVPVKEVGKNKVIKREKRERKGKIEERMQRNETALSIHKRVEKQQKAVRERKNGILIAAATGVAVGGAVRMLDVFVRETPLRLIKKEKRLLRKEYRKMKKEKKDPLHAIEKMEQRKGKKTRKEKNKAEKQNGKIYESIEKNREMKRTVQKERKTKNKREKKRFTIFSLVELKKREKKKTKERQTSSFPEKNRKKDILHKHIKGLKLLVMFHKTTNKILHEKCLLRRNTEQKVQKKQKEQTRLWVLEYVRARIIFMLLHSLFFEKQMDTHKKQENSQSYHESSPWVLFAIIWYLTMLREQGIVTVLPKKKKKKKKKKNETRLHPGYSGRRKKYLAQHGLIYAYHP